MVACYKWMQLCTAAQHSMALVALAVRASQPALTGLHASDMQVLVVLSR